MAAEDATVFESAANAAPDPPGSEPAGPTPAAAFFDLDKTLIQGSSAFQFGRAAYQAGLMGRRQLVSDGIANIRFRLHGSTDEDSLALRDRISASLAGTRVVDLERLGAAVLARILPRLYPEMLDIAHEHQDAGRRAYIVTAASQELADILAQVLVLDGAIGSNLSQVVDGVYTGTPEGLFVYRAQKAQAIQELAGHADLTTTMRYMHLSPAARQGAIELLNTRGKATGFGEMLETVSSGSASGRNH